MQKHGFFTDLFFFVFLPLHMLSIAGALQCFSILGRSLPPQQLLAVISLAKQKNNQRMLACLYQMLKLDVKIETWKQCWSD